MRAKYCIANWKMNLTVAEGVLLAKSLAAEVGGAVPKVVICPPFTHILPVKTAIADAPLSVAAQNCAATENGAYTGEVSAAMLAAEDINYVIVGHSERRQYFGESNDMLKNKTDMTIKHGICAVFCCGESLAIREKNQQNEYVKKQLTESLFHLSAAEIQQILIAYEPIWAIGTGRTATTEQAQEMHAFIRATIAEKYDTSTADSIPILYGGSVNAENAASILRQQDIDGVLVGGASLKSDSFLSIIKSF